MPVHHAFIALLITATTAVGAGVDYQREIKPLLHEKCSACHGALKQEAGLRLDAAILIHEGGDSGAAIKVGDSASSLIVQRVNSEDADERMPPEGEGERLKPEEFKLLQEWIEGGAIAPDDEQIPSAPEDHWAYQQPVRSTVPKASDPEWQNNPVDAFIGAQHRSAQIHPVAVADKQTFVRRLYFDLIGLPPNRQQIDDFVNDESSGAYSRLIDELLESPQYGERWGRHWMDVWRYSDWSGYKNQLRGSQRHIWRWRDWIIESLNEDKGYDQMIVEMLAGDEIAPDNLDVLRATGFLARNFHKSNRNIWLDATVEHTAKAFLGITINCARCHDHKFDPIAQSDYYAMRAIFEPHNVRTERIPGQRNVVTDGIPRAFDAEPEAKTFLYLQGNEKHFDKESPVAAAIPSVFDEVLDVQPVALPPIAVFPALWPQVEAEDNKHAKQQLNAAKRQLALAKDLDSTALATLKLNSAQADYESLVARWAADKAKYARLKNSEFDSVAKLAAEAQWAAAISKAEFDLADKEAEHAAAKATDEKDAAKKDAAIKKANKDLAAATKQLAKAKEAPANDTKYASVGKVYPNKSTGRRLALAKWIVGAKNPLTARVAINHIWLRHFGEPLVSNTFDFGLRSARPTHAELLDWLAVEFVEHQWSMKHIHRLLVTSRTYQLRSSADSVLTAANTKVDPDNQLFWRANIRRLDAEVIRDSVLQVAGSLDLTQGGADIDYASGETVARRSVYFRHAYEKQMTMLVLFDSAGPNECYRRSESIVPQQALALANSSLSLTASRKLARSLWAEVANGAFKKADAEARFISLAFKQTLARAPSDKELTACQSFLKQQATMLATPASLTPFDGKATASVEASSDPELRANENLVHVLMNHNDFVTVR